MGAPICIANALKIRHYRTMPIRIATHSDIQSWVELRAQLWDDTLLAQHRAEAVMMLAKSPYESIVFLDAVDGVGIRAFAEAALRHDHVNGCNTSPVAFLEGIYVRPQDRGSGIGKMLLNSIQAWAHERGCSELASDASIETEASHAFHTAFGFAETARVVYFCKPI